MSSVNKSKYELVILSPMTALAAAIFQKVKNRAATYGASETEKGELLWIVDAEFTNNEFVGQQGPWLKVRPDLSYAGISGEFELQVHLLYDSNFRVEVYKYRDLAIDLSNLPKPREMWQHERGGIYYIDYQINMDATEENSEKFPPFISYRDTLGRLWGRPLSEFLNKFKRHPECPLLKKEMQAVLTPASAGVQVVANPFAN